MLNINIFTDCLDENAKGRQVLRYESLFPGAKIDFNGLVDRNVSTLAGIVDILDATRFGKISQIIICNVAPREEKQYPNGRPFCFAKIGNAIVIGTEGSFVFLKKLGVINEVQETDVFTVCKKFLDLDEAQRIASSQFRSFDYVPLLASWLFQEKEIPSVIQKLEFKEALEQVWFRDCFGNCKTTLTEKNAERFVADEQIFVGFNDQKEFIKLPFYRHLSGVPNNTIALIVGSSGYKNNRFLEIVKQGGSAGKDLNIESGTKIFLK